MKRKSRRISNGFGYIGFGNRQSNFNQKNAKPFSSIKERLDEESHYHFKIHFTHKKLTKTERDLIKNNIRKSERKRNFKTIFVFLIIASFLSYFIKLGINAFVSRL